MSEKVDPCQQLQDEYDEALAEWMKAAGEVRGYHPQATIPLSQIEDIAPIVMTRETWKLLGEAIDREKAGEERFVEASNALIACRKRRL